VKPESQTAAFTYPPTLPGGGRALLAGGLAADLASVCCLEPLLIGRAVIAVLLARRCIWRKASACDLGQVCVLPRFSRACKVAFWFVTALVVTALAFPLMVPLFD
jgi:mercuric ion transport protein